MGMDKFQELIKPKIQFRKVFVLIKTKYDGKWKMENRE
jgi:hypothetical protein